MLVELQSALDKVYSAYRSALEHQIVLCMAAKDRTFTSKAYSRGEAFYHLFCRESELGYMITDFTREFRQFRAENYNVKNSPGNVHVIATIVAAIDLFWGWTSKIWIESDTNAEFLAKLIEYSQIQRGIAKYNIYETAVHQFVASRANEVKLMIKDLDSTQHLFWVLVIRDSLITWGFVRGIPIYSRSHLNFNLWHLLPRIQYRGRFIDCWDLLIEMDFLREEFLSGVCNQQRYCSGGDRYKSYEVRWMRRQIMHAPQQFLQKCPPHNKYVKMAQNHRASRLATVEKITRIPQTVVRHIIAEFV